MEDQLKNLPDNVNNWSLLPSFLIAENKSSSTSITFRSDGNNLLKKNQHKDTIIKAALINYSKSIAYAPPGSEELALGHNNRSFLLQHIKKYDLALLDISEALSITRSPLLKVKLLIRKISCLKAMGKKLGPSVMQEVEQLLDKINPQKMKENVNFEFNKALKVKTDIGFSAFVAEPMPKMKRSKKIPCASNTIEVKYDKTFGKHLIANSSISPGEILIIEDAYVTFPSFEERFLICSHCLDVTFVSVPCESCPCIVYCSKLCKNIAWDKYHKIECSILKLYVYKDHFNNGFLRYLRNVIKALNEIDFQLDKDYEINANKAPNDCFKEFVDGQFQSDKLRYFYTLEDHKENLEKSYRGTIKKSSWIEDVALRIMIHLKPIISTKMNISEIIYGKIFRHSLGWHALKEFIKKIIRISMVNSFRNVHYRTYSGLGDIDKTNIFEDAVGILGTSLSICCSLINHSCSPNVGRLFRNGKMIFFALRPINKGEQIFTTYSHQIDSEKSTRQQHLRQNFFFDCKCLACEQDLSVDPDFFAAKQRQLVLQTPEDWETFLKGNQKLQAALRCGPSKVTSLKNLLLLYAKWKIGQIYQSDQMEKAIVKSFVYENILRQIYHDIYSSSDSTLVQCC